MAGGDLDTELQALLAAAGVHDEPRVLPDPDPVVVVDGDAGTPRRVGPRVALVAAALCLAIDGAVLAAAGSRRLPALVALVWLEPPLVLGAVLLRDRVLRRRRS